MCFLVGLLKANTGLWGEECSNYQFLQPNIITRFLTLHGTSFCLLFWIYFLLGADIRKPRSVAGRQSGGQWSGASCSSGRVDRYPTELLKMSLLLAPSAQDPEPQPLTHCLLLLPPCPVCSLEGQCLLHAHHKLGSPPG